MMDKECLQKKIRVTKLVRSTMEELTHFLKKNEHCTKQIKVIHLLRDPRGKINSLLKLNNGSSSPKKNARYFPTELIISLCKRQIKDIALRTKLQKVYPKMFMELYYEQISSNPLMISEYIYNFSYGTVLSSSVKKWIINNTQNKKSSEEHYNTQRKNSTATSLAWKTELDPHLINNIKNHCTEFITYLNRKDT